MSSARSTTEDPLSVDPHSIDSTNSLEEGQITSPTRMEISAATSATTPTITTTPSALGISQTLFTPVHSTALSSSDLCSQPSTPMYSLLNRTLIEKYPEIEERGKKRKLSPQKDQNPGLSNDQAHIVDCVFSCIESVINEHLRNFKDKLSTDCATALERYKDEIDSVQSMHSQEVGIIRTELDSTKEQYRIMEGRLIRAEKEIQDLKEQQLMSEARSMRDNLIFYNITEPTQENPETTLNNFLKDEMKVNDDDLKKIKFDRVHRIGKKEKTKTRPLIAKFNPSSGKGLVLSHAKNLNKEKKFGVNEQLPRELEERKKHLLPQYREARSQDKKPKWSLDKLVINNKVHQVKRDRVRDITMNTTEKASTMKIKKQPPRTYNKSTFQGHSAKIRSQDDVVPALHALYADTNIARADHNIYAYRIQSGDQVIEHFDDDKEYGAGRKLLLLLRSHNITNKFVCVTRWYGGVNLGPARFEYILEAAKQTLGIDVHSKPAAEHKHSHHAELHGLTQVSSHSSGRRSSLRSNSDDDSESDASNTDNEH